METQLDNSGWLVEHLIVQMQLPQSTLLYHLQDLGKWPVSGLYQTISVIKCIAKAEVISSRL